MGKKYILALDQGTTSSKAIILDREANIVAVSGNFPIPVQSPRAGWVEYDPEHMLQSLVDAGRDVVKAAMIHPSEIAIVGLANQGETVIAFDKKSGDPICRAISWQDRRTLDIVTQWQKQGFDIPVEQKTGLRLDPYFSASKIHWILENIEAAASLLETNRLGLATSDVWLLSRLTGGEVFATDRSTASRTMMLNLDTLDWDEDLLQRFEIPRKVLPDLVDNSTVVGDVHRSWFGCTIPLGGLCVDQQAALFGQRCFQAGQAKLTYGTGCFMLANVGPHRELRNRALLTSLGWQLRDDAHYVFDGGIYTAGSVVDWMIDKLKLADSSAEIDQLLEGQQDSGGPFFIPALAGLAAPYWEPDMRGAWFGLTLAHDRKDLLRAAMESIAFRVKDIFDAMVSSGLMLDSLKVDGGLTRSKFLMQYQADLLGIPLEAGEVAEATAYGIGLLSGLAGGFFASTAHFPESDQCGTLYQPDGRRSGEYLERYRQWRRITDELISWQKRGITASK